MPYVSNRSFTRRRPHQPTHSTLLSLTFFSSPKKTFSISCLEISPRLPVWPEVADLNCAISGDARGIEASFATRRLVGEEHVDDGGSGSTHDGELAEEAGESD